MKRALIITLSLFFLSVTGFCLAYGGINAAKDKVELEEIAVFADKTKAQGLEVYSSADYDRHLRWDTFYTVGETPKIETDFLFTQKKIPGAGSREYMGVSLESPVLNGDFFEAENMEEPRTGIDEVYRQLYLNTPADSEKQITIRIKDYYDFYPIVVSLDLPGINFDWQMLRFADSDAYEYLRTEIELASKIQEFFKIPVSDGALMEINLWKHYDGSAETGSSLSGDYFSVWTQSVVTDDACYFTFGNQSSDGEIVDTSFIPGGYGIYRLPLHDAGEGKAGEHALSTGELSMAYPIDTNAELLYLLSNSEKTKLLLFTKEQGKCVLTVIDAQNMETLQRLELGELDEEKWIYAVYVYDDFIAAEFSECRIALIEVNEQEEYEHCFTAEYTDPENSLFYLSRNSAMDWDGERLAIADYLEYEKYNGFCSFYLAVCDETGLAYYGEYLSSLDIGNGTASKVCNNRSYDGEPLRLRWQ